MYQGINWLSFGNHFFQYKDTLRFFQAYDNYIYNISNSTITKAFKLVYKKDPLPDDVLNEIVKTNLMKFKSSLSPKDAFTLLDNYYAFMGTWLESDKYIYIDSRKGNNGMVSIINKQNYKAEYISNYFCENRQFKLDIPNFMSYNKDNNSFVSIVFGEILKDHIYKDSKFLKELIINPETFYIINIKFKK